MHVYSYKYEIKYIDVAATNEKKTMNLKESKEVYVGGFGWRKGKGR